jgi:serine/threonine-protein kinase
MPETGEATTLLTVIHEEKRRPDTTFPPPGWNAGTLRAIEELLAPYVGPMARVLIKKSAKTTTDGLALVRLLAENIPSERDREAFLGAALEKVSVPAQSEAARDRSSPGLSRKLIEAGDIDKAASQLAHYLGPIAKVLAKKGAGRAHDLKTFYLQLAENLADPGERTEFLKKSGYGD